MSIGDILSDIGKGAATGARAVGAVLPPVLQRTAQVLSGEAPQIDEEKRQQATQMDDAALNAKADELEAQLAMGRKYGTLTPQQQQQYVDQITGLFSHPKHMNTLMTRLQKAIHPGGATYQQNEPLPSATPTGGTVAADARLQEGTEARKLADAMTLIDRRAQEQAATREPKPLKSEVVGNMFLGVSDQNTGKTYGVSDLAPGGAAPPEAKALYQEYQKGRQAQQDQKEKDRKAENAEIMKRTEVTNANMLERMQLQFQNMLAMGNFRAANSVVQGLEKNYANSLDLENKMQKLAGQAFSDGKPNQQAQLAILANHIAMTTHQPGAAMRPTKALFDEAAAAQPWMQKIEKRFDSDGYLVGVVLSPQQVQQMVDLAPVMVNADLSALNQTKGMLSDQLNPAAATPAGKTGAKKVGNLLSPSASRPAQAPNSKVDSFLKNFQ